MQPSGYGNLSDGRLDATFAALADRTRRALIAKLARGEASVLELAEPHDMSQPAISKHLKVLERAGLITRSRDGQRRPCRLVPRRLKLVADWVTSYRDFWEQSHSRLDAVLQEMQGQPKNTDKEPSHATFTKARSHRRSR